MGSVEGLKERTVEDGSQIRLAEWVVDGTSGRG